MTKQGKKRRYITPEYIFVKKYFQVSDEHIAILEEFLKNKNQEVPYIDLPNVFYKGLINAGVMEDSDTYMTAFNNLRKLYNKE